MRLILLGSFQCLIETGLDIFHVFDANGDADILEHVARSGVDGEPPGPSLAGLGLLAGMQSKRAETGLAFQNARTLRALGLKQRRLRERTGKSTFAAMARASVLKSR